MVRRVWALVLAAALMLGATPLAAYAVTEEEEALIQATKKSYRSGLAATGKSSFRGLCGAMVSYQLRYFGITRYAELWNGNKQFDNHAASPITSGGYYTDAYPAGEFTLEEALNAVTAGGTRDTGCILVGFERTDTEAGARFGHACVISGIIDGKVYFTESFNTSIGGPEGSVICCTIEEFAEFYRDWTEFEGLVHFCESYAQTCVQYGTDIFVRTRFSMSLRSQPRLVGQGGCTVLRTLSAGERLRVNAVVKNDAGELFYQVLDGGRMGYIVAQTATLDRVNGEDLLLEDAVLPESFDVGQAPALKGVIRAKYGLVGAVELVISDEKGEVIDRQQKIVDGSICDLETVGQLLQLEQLQKGRYTLSVYADTASAHVFEDALTYSYATMLLAQQTLWVGMEPQQLTAVAARSQRELKDGWLWEGDSWYYYDHGKTRSGWVRYLGVEYYLQADGAVTVGWSEVDGVMRCFSDTGALCVGWLTTEKGTHYAFSDGRLAEGWQTIGTARYYFDGTVLQTEGERADGDRIYRLQPDGKAVPVEQEAKK